MEQDSTNEQAGQVTFYSLMGVEAARLHSRCGGGFRLWVLAKALDQKGLGRVSRKSLQEFLASFGVSSKQFRRWMDEARRFDFISDVQALSGEWIVILSAPYKPGASLGLSSIGVKVQMRAADLIGKGWRARVWGGYQATHGDQPISRGKMQTIVNVPVSTQRYRDAQAGVKRTRNIAKTEDKQDRLAGLQEHGSHKGVFVFRDGTIGYRLPNSYAVNFAERVGRGRSRQANKLLQNNALSTMGRGLNCGVVVRLFNRTPEQLDATMRKLARADHRVSEIFEQGKKAKSGASLWTPRGVR